MRVWSKGLGRRALHFDMGQATLSLEREDSLPAQNVPPELVRGNPVISGKTIDPVIWEFKVWMEEEDAPSLIRIALSGPMVSLILRYYLKRFGRLFRGPRRSKQGMAQKSGSADQKQPERENHGTRAATTEGLASPTSSHQDRANDE